MARKILRFVVASGMYGGTEGLSRAIQAGALFYLARILPKEEYGLVGMVVSAQQIVTVAALGGLIESVTGSLNEYRLRNQLPHYFGNAHRLFLRTSLAIAALYLVGLFMYRAMTHVPAGPFALALIVGLLIAYVMLESLIFRLQEDHKTAVWYKTIPIIAASCGGLLFQSLVADRVLGFFAGAAVSLCAAVLVLRRIHAPRNEGTPEPDTELMRGLWIGALPFLAVTILGWLSGYGNNMFIKYFFTNAEVAEFTVIATLTSILSLAMSAITQVWSPHFFVIAARGDMKSLIESNRLVVQVQSFVLSLVSAVILLYFRDATRIIGGHFASYANILPYLFVTLASYVVLILYYGSFDFFLLHKRGSLYLKFVVWSSGIGTVLWVVLMATVGRWGIYIGFFLMMASRSAGAFYLARREWQVRLSPLDIPIGVSLITAAFLLGGAGFLAKSVAFASIVLAALVLLVWMNRPYVLRYAPAGWTGRWFS